MHAVNDKTLNEKRIKVLLYFLLLFNLNKIFSLINFKHSIQLLIILYKLV